MTKVSVSLTCQILETSAKCYDVMDAIKSVTVFFCFDKLTCQTRQQPRSRDYQEYSGLNVQIISKWLKH